jgi:hypothetical protein
MNKGHDQERGVKTIEQEQRKKKRETSKRQTPDENKIEKNHKRKKGGKRFNEK